MIDFKTGAELIDFKILETFKLVVDLRSFHGAAKNLRTTQPAVSLRIKQLEAFLGFRLLDRDRRRVALTPEGEEFLFHAERLIRLRGEMIEAVGDPSTVRGIFRLGVSESIVHTWLPTLLKRVAQTYPNLRPEIEVDISPKLLDGLVARDLHLALLLEPVNNPNVRSRRLCSFPVAFIASQNIKFPDRSLALKDIVEHRIITFARHTKPYAELRAIVDRAGLDATIWASASLETVVRLALDGDYIAVIPPDIIEKRGDARKKLRPLNTRVKLPNLDYAVGWPSVHDDDPRVRKVVDIAMEVAQEWQKAK